MHRTLIHPSTSVKFTGPPTDDMGMNSFTPIKKLYTLSLIPSPVYGPSRASTPIVVVSRTCVDCGLVRSPDVHRCTRCH